MSKFFEFKVTLAGIEPPIWRSFLIAQGSSFADLHDAIQDAGGWTNSHLHEFVESGGRVIAGMQTGDGDEGEPEIDSLDLALTAYFGLRRGRHHSCIYRYDMGDDWEHDVQLIREVTARGRLHRRLTGGARAFPLDDMGGTDGYQNYVKALKARNPTDEQRDRLNWLSGWSPEWSPFHWIAHLFDRAEPCSGALGAGPDAFMEGGP